MTIAVGLIVLWICSSAAFVFGFVIRGALGNASKQTSAMIDFTPKRLGEGRPLS